MTDTLKLAKALILEPARLREHEIQVTLDRMLGYSIDTADIYFQSTRSESWILEDGIVKEASHSIEQGVGVRAVSGEKTGFAYSDEIALPALTRAATAARAIASHGGNGKLQAWRRTERRNALYQPNDPLLGFSEQKRVDILKTIDAETRRQDPRVTQVIVGLVGEFSAMLVAGTDGAFAGDIRPLVRLNVHVIVEQNGRREQGSAGGGGRYAYDVFWEEGRGLGFGREAVRQALVNLEAVDVPAGAMTVVLGPGWPGILLHEAVGHGLEGDFNRKGSSAFAGRVGEKVATEYCTVVDDGTLPERRGSLNVDDEGTPTECTVLIEKGILVGYLHDKLNARLMGTQSTGNGRRESYAHLPMPRMTNTYLLPGQYAHEEIIASVDKGLYAAHFGGGQVDITSGKFVFSASEAYLIEKGRITRPVKGATLIGNGPDVLTKVTMLGNDLALDDGVGVCGKEGQSIPVGVGQPTLRIDSLTVGGTEVE
uniref:TldD protein n=1 Tax=Candidatus Kentrum eta TaxID=2126337 RepID=A0A450VDH2_9GAMM|nr:MAG: microcin-processing peptidase 2. Unknown type peptidase. MEROPS family U62 [Candidatus Kentron sp. H]VFK02836.1 MAG: microcin-processing peptidase 2. Unknown type peptidase. MEROPS family U62 [Candidatus Kentron sp. H]VFK05835.1 MAG: microcin-processing peptidase 2. Unknown type peptidase. MEROPS family U62 [Candidatus Kentron sp. H]